MRKLATWWRRRHWRRVTILLLSIVSFLQVSIGVMGTARPCDAASKPPPPNILLIVTDDVGIDQWKLFGYGGVTPAATPNIDAIAKAGVRFHNMWAMPS